MLYFSFRKNRGFQSIDWFDIENVISSESVSIFEIIIMVSAWSGMTKLWQDFQFPFSRNCQIVLLDEIKSSCAVKYFNSSYLSPCGSWSRPVQYLIWSIRDPSLNVSCVIHFYLYCRLVQSLMLSGWLRDLLWASKPWIYEVFMIFSEAKWQWFIRHQFCHIEA